MGNAVSFQLVSNQLVKRCQGRFATIGREPGPDVINGSEVLRSVDTATGIADPLYGQTLTLGQPTDPPIMMDRFQGHTGDRGDFFVCEVG